MTRTTLLISALLLAAGAAASAGERPDARECAKVKAEIRKIQARMRRGYSAAEGVKLNEKLLDLRERRARLCR